MVRTLVLATDRWMTGFAISWPAVLSVLAGLASLALARWVWRFRGRPGATYWTANQVVIGVWALTYGVALTTFDPALRGLFEPLLWFTRCLAPPLILLFALDYTGRDRFTRPRFAGFLVGVWLLAFVFYMTNGVHGLAWTGYQVDPVFGAAAVSFAPGIGLYGFASLAYVFNATAALLILGPLVSYRRLFGRQAAAILVVLAFPTLANVAWLFRLGPTGHLDLTPIMFLVAFGGMSYALFREELFEFLPATTRVASDIAIDDINAAVLTVSPNGRIVDLNTAAADLFDLERSTALGRSLEAALAVDVPLEETALSVSDPGGHNREFDVDVSPIESATGDRIGYVVTFYDITEERRRQQRLAVQNRVLRHNLRNGMAVVDGNVERIEQVADGEEVAQLAETIHGTAGELLAVSEKVRRFDEALAEDPEPIDVVRVCRAVAGDLRERHPEATVTVDADPTAPDDADATATVEGRTPLLVQVLEEVVENGIVHDEEGEPHVDITLDAEGEDVVIAVADEGPGIPDEELEVLHSGDEDALSHGSSIGLWIVEWGVGVLGGSVRFDADGDGTTVTIRLPGA